MWFILSLPLGLVISGIPLGLVISGIPRGLVIPVSLLVVDSPRPCAKRLSVAGFPLLLSLFLTVFTHFGRKENPPFLTVLHLLAERWASNGPCDGVGRVKKGVKQ